MANTRLTCVVRRGLQLPEGLLAAQVAHISDQWMRNRILSGDPFSVEEKEWMQDPYISIVAVNTLEELEVIYKEGVQMNLTPVRWTDNLYSEVLQKTLPHVLVGISLGPSDFDAIQTVTGNLNRY
jgi:peptidyl-tRNA hydrolase